MTRDIPQGIGWTALVVAAQRAAESQREDALFHDVLAERLVERVGEGAHGGEGAGETRTPPLRRDEGGGLTPMARLLGDYMSVRTRFFDDRLLEAAADGIDQVVVLAAGLDARPFRLDWPTGTHIFEIDTQEVLVFKAAAAEGLVPAAGYRTVPVDLHADWPAALVDAGFDPSRRTIWLAEGLLIYLSADANDLLLSRVGALSAPGSRLATEWSDGDPSSPSGEGLDEELLSDPAVALFRDLLHEGPSATPQELFTRLGWTATVTTLPGEAERLGREAPPAMDERRGGTLSWLVEARR